MRIAFSKDTPGNKRDVKRREERTESRVVLVDNAQLLWNRLGQSRLSFPRLLRAVGEVVERRAYLFLTKMRTLS
jgi:hypothetical protein